MSGEVIVPRGQAWATRQLLDSSFHSLTLRLVWHRCSAQVSNGLVLRRAAVYQCHCGGVPVASLDGLHDGNASRSIAKQLAAGHHGSGRGQVLLAMDSVYEFQRQDFKSLGLSLQLHCAKIQAGFGEHVGASSQHACRWTASIRLMESLQRQPIRGTGMPSDSTVRTLSRTIHHSSSFTLFAVIYPRPCWLRY